LTTLRVLNKDGFRKTVVLKFLIESGLTQIVNHLSGADLRSVDLGRTNLGGANLSEADLSGSNLYRALLFNTNLSGANLSEANLRRTQLYKANLSRANLSGADLSEARLYGANLSEANLSGVGLSKARYDSDTGWPEGFDPSGHGAILVKERACQDDLL
jgi:uncharacterized protein YjbI with pentapeptide repeats